MTDLLQELHNELYRAQTTDSVEVLTAAVGKARLLLSRYRDGQPAPPAVPDAASTHARLDYAARSLRNIADKGRAALGDSYPEIVALWATIRDIAAQATPVAAVAQPMTLAEFCAEADRIGLTAQTLARQLAARPEFADCLPSEQKVAQPVAGTAVVECERCGLSPEAHTPNHFCDNQSFAALAASPSCEQSDAQRLAFMAEDGKPRYVENHRGWHRVYEDIAPAHTAQHKWAAMDPTYHKSVGAAVDAAIVIVRDRVAANPETQPGDHTKPKN